MTATLDFAPNSTRLAGYAHARTLPVYDWSAEAMAEMASEPIGFDTSARRPGSTGLRINAVVAFVLGAIVIVVLLLGFGTGAAANRPFEPVSPQSRLDANVEVYVVQPGDTLWAIAGRVAPAGADLRPVVDMLSETAGGSSLDVGQRIRIDHATLGGA